MEIYAKVGDLLTCPYCIMPLYRMREIRDTLTKAIEWYERKTK